MALFKKGKKNVEPEKTPKQIATEKRAKRKEARDRAVNAVAEDLKIETEEAAEIVDEAVTRLKIGHTDLRRGRFWRLPEEQQESACAKYLEAKREQRRRNKEIEQVNVNRVCEQSGWDYDTAKAAIMDAKKRTKCKYREYIMFSFWNKTPEEQESYFLYEHTNEIQRRYNSPLFYRITENKMLTNMLFSKYLRRAWCLNYGIEFDEFEKLFGGSSKVVYKPQKGTQGIGIKIFDFSESSIREVYDELIALPKGIVEEFVYQHPDLQTLNPTSVNTIRFVTVSWIEDLQLKVDTPFAFFRIGNGRSVDNLHSGGMGAAVDMETGELVTEAEDLAGNVYAEHPETHEPIKGFVIPHFDQVKEFVVDIIKKNKVTGYIGWDIAVAEDGPMLIEINSASDSTVLQLPYTHLNKGMKHVMAKYLEEEKEQEQ